MKYLVYLDYCYCGYCMAFSHSGRDATLMRRNGLESVNKPDVNVYQAKFLSGSPLSSNVIDNI